MRHFERRLQYRIVAKYLLIASIVGIAGTMAAVIFLEPTKKGFDIPFAIFLASWMVFFIILIFGWRVKAKKELPDFDYYFDVDENFIGFKSRGIGPIYLEDNVICVIRSKTLDLYDDNGECIEDIGYDDEVIQFLKKYPKITFARWQDK